MNYTVGVEKMNVIRREIADLRAQMRATQADIEPEAVADYAFKTPEGTARLSDLFGTHRDLIVIHNMGTSCPNCTLWADGYNGLHHHVVSRTGFVVSSPDSPEVQQKFASSRGWKFRMVSHAGTTFAADMGYRSVKGWMPGISVFKQDGNTILRVSDAGFGPGDDYCTLWHFFDLLPGGAGGWKAKFSYS